MKNFEKYENELKKYDAEELCSKLIKPIILKKDSCPSNNCKMCCRLLMLWMGEEYKPEPPKVDWSKIKVDTPILVRQGEKGQWLERHFAKYENGRVYAWVDGQTSWTGADEIKWKYAKLAEVGEECEEPKVDWSKVEVDTPILVKAIDDGKWKKRHFAKYKNGNVYAWSDGQTSWTAYDMMVWKYAKLAEDAKEDKEPEVDWSQVEIDTPIMVKFKEDKEWVKRHFAKYENGRVYTWKDSHTSWTSLHNDDVTAWNYAKLAEDEKECKDPEVDWSKVEVDTPILVKYSEKGMWIRRKFAKFEDGVVYAWHGKETGHSKSYMTPWNYAKLAESERKDNINESNANNRR